MLVTLPSLILTEYIVGEKRDGGRGQHIYTDEQRNRRAYSTSNDWTSDVYREENVFGHGFLYRLYWQHLQCYYRVGGHQKHFKLVFGEQDHCHHRHGYGWNLHWIQTEGKVIFSNGHKNVSSACRSSIIYSTNIVNSFDCFGRYSRSSLVNSTSSKSLYFHNFDFPYFFTMDDICHLFMLVDDNLSRLANKSTLSESNSNFRIILHNIICSNLACYDLD